MVKSYFKPDANGDERFNRLRLSRISTILAPWRVSKNVYRFDPDIYRALIATSLRGNLPVDLLFKMPEWAVYIETPALDTYFGGGQAKGFVASLNYSSEVEGEVKLSFLTFRDESPYIHWLYVRRDITIEESIAQAARRGERALSEMRVSFQRPKYPVEGVVNYVSKLVNLLLYICQTNSEYRDIRDADGSDRLPRNPLPKKTKKGLRYFPPDKPTVWECGMRQGAVLRRALAAERSESMSGTHKSPITHIRVAHWHTYIIGKGSRKDPSKGRRVLKWIHTVLVKAGKREVEVPVIRDVD
jgi:hypothetical protein